MSRLDAPQLVHYAPGLQQARHAHAQGSLCLILSGHLVERVGTHEVQVGAGHWCHKPAGVEHSTHFGPRGASLLQLALPPGLEESRAAPWRWGASVTLFSLLGSAAERGVDAELLRDALLLLTGGTAPGRAPPWWPRALQSLQEGEARIDAVAAECGVHRAQLVRVAQAQSGASPVALRQRARLARSLARLQGEPGLSLAELAAAEGYADQAHFSRDCQRWLGLSPARWRRAAAGVPSTARR
jgi:AraC family transcriptional regulator